MNKMRMNKWLMTCVVMLMAVSILAACGGTKNEGANKNDHNQSTNAAKGNDKGDNSNKAGESTGGEKEAPFKLTIMANLHTPEIPSDKIQKLIEEITNTELDIQWVPDGNYDEKLNTAFATGTMPQATYLRNINSFAMFKDAIRNDQFWEIGPLLSEYENLNRMKETVLNNTSVDGKIYSLYQGRPLSRQGLIYRKDWADALGIAAPTTTEDLMEMARRFTEDDPDGNGQQDTIGLTDRADLVYGAFKTLSSYFGTPNNWGEKDGQLLPEFMFDEYIQTMDFMREMRENGYINQDFPVTSKNDQQAMFKNGKAGMYIGSMGDVLSIYNDAVKLNPDIVYDVQNRIAGPGQDNGVWSIPGYGTIVLFPKSAVKDEAELRRILAFFDHLMAPEVANLINWGIEGEHYQVVDGLADASIADNDLKSRDVQPYQGLELGEPDTNLRYEGIFTYEVKGKAEELIKDNENFLINDPTAPLDSDTYNEIGASIYEQIKDATYQYMLGDLDVDGFNKAVDTWRSQGGDRIIDEFNASWKAAQ